MRRKSKQTTERIGDESKRGTEKGENASPLIVGLGASAGGLEALTQFCAALPKEPGAAFVIIQHLDPTHESLMPELLSRHTSLPVRQVKERVRVDANTIYIIPPDKYLSLNEGHLELGDPPANRAEWAAIDHFFHTLAQVQQERAICVVLSGRGNDGTLGLKAVKAYGGMALVQSPETAQHEGMPRSAIATGAVDRVAAPRQIAETITRYVNHPYVAGHPDGKGENEMDDDAYGSVLSLLHARTGHQFSCYKSSTLFRRIQRRMSLHHLEKVDDYLHMLESNSNEVDELFRDLLIGVTSFFREPAAWKALAEKVLPQIVDRCPSMGTIRVWAPGCSTGEEAYTAAMLLSEAIERSRRDLKFTIFATDIDKGAFDRARAGVYPAAIASQVSSERLDRFFERINDHYEVKKILREQVVFAPQSLIHDPPFSRLDLVICRNVLIYLDSEVQKKIIRLFHFALREEGVLFLGPSETIGPKEDLFTPISNKWRICRKRGMSRPGAVDIPIMEGGVHKPLSVPIRQGRSSRRGVPQAIAHEALVNEFAPAAVLIDRQFDILYHHGPRHEYLQLPSGEPTDNLLDQARPGLRQKLRGLLNAALSSGERVEAEDGRVKRDDGEYSHVHITIMPLRYPREAEGMLLVTFRACDTAVRECGTVAQPRTEADESEVSQLEYELKATREELQSTIEERETSNEELKTSNEEIMSMNEELQSTNEELETSKEELQSLNEELITVNNELQEKIGELEKANDDLGNLLASTHIATMFLDRDLCIKRFTPSIMDLMYVMSSDLGRPLKHIAHRFEDPSLIYDARQVLATLTPVQSEIVTDEERWYIRRIMPYRTRDDRIDGLVITFVEITAQKGAEKALRESEQHTRRIIDNQQSFVAVLEPDGTLIDVNVAALEAAGLTREEVAGRKFWDCGWAAHDPALQERLKEDIKQASQGEAVRHDETFHTGENGQIVVDFMISPVRDEQGQIIQLIPSGVDITDRKQTEKDLAARELQFRRAIEQSPLPAILYDEDGKVLILSRVWTEITGYTLDDLPTLDDWIRKAYIDRYDELSVLAKTMILEEKTIENLDHVIRCKNGEERVWRFSSRPLGMAPSGRKLRITKAVDVTELRAANDRMEALNHTLEEKVADRTAELEKTSERLRRLAQELTQTEQRERRRLASTLHDNLQQLIAVAHMQVGRLQGAGPTDIKKVLSEVEQTLEEASQACRSLTTELAPPVLYDDGLIAGLSWLCEWMERRHKLKVECDLKEDIGGINQDIAVLLFQSVRELLFNVIKHADVTKATLTVDEPDPDWVRLVVADQGCGFDAEAIADHRGGSDGFGLFSIRERISVMGGRMTIESGKGGTRVVLAVPSHGQPAEAAMVGAERSVIDVEPPKEDEPIRILIADDHTMSRQGLAHLLSEHDGLELVAQAEDGQQAIELCREHRPHVVIMDVNMPNMNGIEATRRLTREMPRVNVVGLSVQTDTGTRSSMLKAGAVDLVLKGGRVDELWKLIQAIVRKRGCISGS